MLNVAQGSLAIIDGKDVYWKGVKLTGVESVIVHSFDNSTMVKLDIRDAAAVLVAELAAAGIKVKVL